MKIVRKIKTGVTFMLLGVVFLFSCMTVTKAQTVYDDWNTYGYYGDTEDVSQFGAKSTDSYVWLNIRNSSGTMDFKVVGALRYNPTTDYADCSQGRTYRAYAANYDQTFEMYNMVNEWNYTYAGVLGMAVDDEYTSASGYFQTDY